MERCQEIALTSSLHDQWWWLDVKATSGERMCCGDIYESILGFSIPCCHQTLLHLAKITMSSWHSVLPMHMSSHNIFSPKILHLNERHLFRCVTHWYCTMVERWLHTRHTNGMSCWRYFVLCMSVNLQHYIALLLVYQHVVVGLPTTTCCCWFTNMLL